MIDVYGECDGYEIGKEINKECLFHVREAFKNGVKYCFKYLEKKIQRNPYLLGDLENEKNILESLDPKHIVKIIDSNFSSAILFPNRTEIEVAWIVLEYLEGRCLFEIISNDGPFSERIARYYFRELIETLIYLHCKGITHRDIKLENIMFDRYFNLKIIDFGLSISHEDAGKPKNIERGPVGTLSYAAPELFESKVIEGEKLDVFSSGVILFAILSGEMPFKKAELYDKYYRYIYVEDYLYEFWEQHGFGNGTNTFSLEAKNLIEMMIVRDQQTRLSLKEVLNHQWFKLPTASFEEAKEELSLRALSH